VFIKSSLTKELKERAIIDLFQTILNRINEHITNSNYQSLSDIILNKSQYLKNINENLDWISIENLKINNPQRLAIVIYNYLRMKFSKNTKTVKGNCKKAFDNLVIFCDILMDNLNSLNLHEDCLFTQFEDFFNFYVEARNNNTDKDTTEKIKEDMTATIDLIKEESSKCLFN
jgi:hypothetical protein